MYVVGWQRCVDQNQEQRRLVTVLYVEVESRGSQLRIEWEEKVGGKGVRS